MKCVNRQPKISEFVNGALSPNETWEMQAHLAHCSECAQFARDFRKTGDILRAMPRLQVSAGFEARLTERLAQTNRPQRAFPWFARWAGSIAMPARQLRPTFALLVVLVGVGLSTLPHHAQPPQVAATQTDAGLVAQCLEQHSTYVASQPLSDWPAQNLAAHLDSNGPQPSNAAGAADDETL